MIPNRIAALFKIVAPQDCVKLENITNNPRTIGSKLNAATLTKFKGTRKGRERDGLEYLSLRNAKISNKHEPQLKKLLIDKL